MKEIFTAINEEMHVFEQQYLDIVNQNELISSYVNKDNGAKLVRPAIVFLTAGLCGTITLQTQKLALAVELMHHSSLIHDDVIDNGQKRRNCNTINALHGNQLAVLIGDYFLSQTMKQIVATDNINILTDITQVAETMVLGELLQIQLNRAQSLSLEQYFETIRKKTAVLLATCFKLGAYSAGISQQQIQQWYDMGISFGLAFQMADDISDFSQKTSNKDANKDIKEHKITLPLIAALTNMDTMQQQRLLNLYFHHKGTEEEIQQIINQTIENGGIEKAIHIMNQKAQVFDDFLQKIPQNAYSEALRQMLNKIISVK
ncbi:MAG: polyprenyl synthetase family protein [Bacteroidales bacterium]|nr:polyprenyl synthetase family protein [Bacteroidales bacterium]